MGVAADRFGGSSPTRLAAPEEGSTVMHIIAPLFVYRLPGRAAAAGYSWFTAAHVALVVSIAALVVTILVSAVTLYYLRRSTRANEDSARAAEASAKAAEDSATSARENVEVARESVRAAEDSAVSARVSARAAGDSANAARDLLKIEHDREYDRTRPILRGYLVPEPGISGPTNAWLEVHLDASTLQRLQTLLVTVPTGAWFARAGGPGMEPTPMRNDFGFPHEGWHRPPVRPGHPARWRVYRPEEARGTLTATAKCTGEDGTVWEDVEVVINQDFEDPVPADG
jgi:hypothetical protein